METLFTPTIPHILNRIHTPNSHYNSPFHDPPIHYTDDPPDTFPTKMPLADLVA